MALYLLHLQSTSIEEQLRIEETLLKTDQRNWCLINEGSPPTIVMGISGKKEELVDEEKRSRAGVPLIKRFSGGGTVVVDYNTLFITFIFQKETHPFDFPEPIMRWNGELLETAFAIPGFKLKENDFVIGEQKCGGNAQYIRKGRFLHHTSFLWDYETERMELLLHPKKTPTYRQGRGHDDFLCKLKDHAPSREHLIERLKTELKNRYQVQEVCHSSIYT